MQHTNFPLSNQNYFTFQEYQNVLVESLKKKMVKSNHIIL